MKNKRGFNIDEYHKYILLLVAARDEPIKGKIKFQKIMFTLSFIFDVLKTNRDFDDDYYGPYSKTADSKLEYLEQTELVIQNHNRIYLTEEGDEYVQDIVKSMDKRTISIINEHKRFLNDMTINEMLTYIYTAYPETIEGSSTYDKIKPNIERYVISLIKKDKITPRRAGKLLDKHIMDIYEKMAQEGMTVFE